MNVKRMIESLHPLERAVLPVLSKTDDFYEIVKQSGLQDVEVSRALQWLANKGIVKVYEELKELVLLDDNGKIYLKEGLPEKRFLKALDGKALSIDEIIKSARLSPEELSACLGVLKAKKAIEVSENKFKISDIGTKILESESAEENFLKRKFPIEIKTLHAADRDVFESLRKRKGIIKTKLLKLKTAKLTDLGMALLKEGVSGNYTEKLTSAMLRSGEWKNKKFRRYEIGLPAPRIFCGKKQHYRAFLDDVRKKFCAMGFTEMDGPIVESDFWDMDALFMPQFHSARDIHQAYYVRDPEYSKLDEGIVSRVKDAHEKGAGTGSRGWGYKFDIKRTHRNLLRTQGTACSARMLASKELEIPGKYFGITRCFRYDVIDATHNCDFYQVEGIVVEKDLTLRHLFWLLKQFAKEFAETNKIKLVPGYFPFTEPSVEMFAEHPQLGWIELGGAGIFRPEVVKPLCGKDVSVLAWGLGIDRIAMFKLGMKDIRQLFSHDLEFLRSTKVV